MSARVLGERSASFRIVAPVVGVMQLEWNISSALLAGSTMSVFVKAGPSPERVKRSPQNSVRVVSSNKSRDSQA